MKELPRSEYPRPQFARQHWLCLNGEWEFEVDAGDSGHARGLTRRPLASRIIVPFCPESTLSGIGNTDFMNVVWYRKEIQVPAAWKNQRILLHFQAVDYDTTIWINDVEVARHRGGFTPFSAELTGVNAGQTVTIVVRTRDDHRLAKPLGKQSQQYHNYSCRYVRTSGIWQTVWLEPVPQTYLLRARITPDVAAGRFTIVQPISGPRTGLQVRATLADAAGIVVSDSAAADSDFAPFLSLAIPADRRRLWSPADPHLYDLKLELLSSSGAVIDTVESYAGLRSVRIDGQAILINGEPLFQRLVLDQGYYPDGILTAPSDAALVRDIELSRAAGFNGARLHQKVFEERFLYHADRLGYLVWGEFADWGCNLGGPDGDNQQPGATYITQWLEALERDYSHPSIIGWCPLNETHQRHTDRIPVLDDVTRGMYLATKAMDQTRPVLDTSGYSHRIADVDVFDCHDYEQDPAKFAQNHAGLADGKPFINTGANKAMWSPWGYRGQPYFVSEFGGIWWNPGAKPGDPSWGYGERPKSIEEFYTRFEKLCDVLLQNPHMFGYCYTQLTDVYQEQNGIFRFNRSTKFDLARLKAAQQKPAAYERQPLVRK
jgi:beta-galactosidase/beta-glucuronidase